MIEYAGLELPSEDWLGMTDSLKQTNGFFVGQIKYDLPLLPVMGMRDGMHAAEGIIDSFTKFMVQGGVGIYTLIKNKPMAVIARVFQECRGPTQDELDRIAAVIYQPEDTAAEALRLFKFAPDYMQEDWRKRARAVLKLLNG